MRRGVDLEATNRRRLLAQERWAKTREDEQALNRHLDALDRLETARGGGLIREGGTVRAKGRDGLFSLFNRGVLEEAEFRSGLLYRQAFEALERGPPCQLQMQGIASTGREAMGWAERRSHLYGRLKQMEAAAHDRDELSWLRLCAGEGRSVRSVTGGGRAQLAATQGLKRVLGDIAEARGLRTPRR